MTTFFSLFQRNGTFNTPDSIDCIRSQMLASPYDTEGMVNSDPIVMGQATRWYCARDKISALPIRFVINDNEIVFAGNCHLSNHKLLAKTLSLPESTSDAEVICHAYVFYGKEFAQYLLGDFSFALFDSNKAELLLVRDHLGIKPLYYHVNDEFCLASDSIEVILVHPCISTLLDNKVVAEWCINGTAFSQTNTFFESIKKVPRATMLCISSSEIEAQEYWNIDDIQPLLYKSEQDYVEHLRELLETVVTDNLDTTYPLGAHSSGGLDSTVIAIMTGRAGKKSGSAFHTYNWCRPTSDDESICHEWTDARKVALQEGFIHHETGINKESLKQCFLHHNIAIDGTTLFEYEVAVSLQAKQDGVRQIFSGFGGDEILTTRSRDKHHDAIRAGRFLYVLKRLSSEYEAQKNLRPLRLAVNYGRLLYKTLFPVSINQHKRFKTEREEFLKRSELIARDFFEYAEAQYRPETYPLINSILEKQRFMIVLGYHQERLESWAILGRRAGVRYVYPYLDKRIVEFALAIPSELYFKHGKPRYLYLKATENILPDFLKQKAKLPENYRTEQLISIHRDNMAGTDIQKMISLANSCYIDTAVLLERCVQAADTEKSGRKKEIIPTIAITNAILALNINKKKAT